MDKKLKGAVVALIGSLCYGGAQLMGMEERIAKLEELVLAEPEEESEESEEIEESEESPEETETEEG
mgnify:CR=1 FL=1|tara:strand:+ start:1199 stop:1399 length:201 start_codon:yes stop_codon:yes gene_type:complete